MNESPTPDSQDAQAGTEMTLAALVISVFLAAGKVMGYVKVVLLANYFGLSRPTDAFLAVYNGLVFLVYTKIEKLLRPTYLPVFIEHRDRDGEAQAWRITGVIGTLELLTLIVIALGSVIFAEPIFRLLWRAQDASAQEIRMGVMLVRIMAPAMVLLTLSVMPELTLHAYRRFTLPAVAEACFKAAVPLMMIALIGVVWAPDNPLAIYAVACGVVLGSALRLFLQLPGLRPKLRHLRASLWPHAVPGGLRIFALMPPVVLGLVFSTIRVWNDIVVTARMGEGIYTGLDFGRKLSDLAILVLPLAVSFVVYPYLSEWTLQDNRQKLADTLVGMTRVMAFIFVPVSVALILLAVPLSSLVYQFGETRAENIPLISLALQCYAAGIFFFAVEGSINKWYFAMQDTGTPNYVGVGGVILHVLISCGGGLLLGWGVPAVALALTISKSLKVIALYALLRGRIGKIHAAEVYAFAAKLLVCTALMGAVVYLVGTSIVTSLQGWVPPFAPTKLPVLALLAATGIAGGGLFLLVAALLRIEELFTVSKYVKEKIISCFG